LTVIQGCRVFKYKGIVLSTYEDPRHDPSVVKDIWVSEDKDANLFSSRLPYPLQRDPLSRGFSLRRSEKRYGYPICWSQKNYEWYPYLPSVVTFHYSVFRGMSTNPEVAHDGKGWRLGDEELALWRNVEYIMTKTADILESSQLMGLEVTKPYPPSQYGYTQTHLKRDFAKRSLVKSLNAFQRYFGYCSFLMAGSHSLTNTLKTHLYSGDLTVVAKIYQIFDSAASEAVVLAKNLLLSLWEAHKTRNFTGVVLRYWEEYDLGALYKMKEHGVPVYVSWPAPLRDYPFCNGTRINTWWKPNPKEIEALEALSEADPGWKAPLDPPNTSEATSSVAVAVAGRVVPRSLGGVGVYDGPMEYISQRAKAFDEELKSNPERQAVLDRLKSSQTFTHLGKAAYYTFEDFFVTDERTGEQRRLWRRIKLTRHDALSHFQGVDSRHLW
jgi:hypothetical protein